MAAILLDSLVLRGCVRLDVVAVAVRLGTAQMPGNRHSTRHPLPGGTFFGPDADYRASEGEQPGAGRSRRTSAIKPVGFPWRNPQGRTPPVN